MAAVWVALGLPWWLAALALVREGLIGLLVAVKLLVPSVRRRHLPIQAMLLGKVTTAAQFIFFAVVLLDLRGAWTGAAVAAATLGLLAGIQYALRATRALQGEPLSALAGRRKVELR